MSNVEQNRLKRAGLGLRAHDAARACAGFTLFSPISGDGTVYLIDMDGTVVHTWDLPYPPGQYGYLLDNGHLLYSGKVRDANPAPRFRTWPGWKGGVVLEADWHGRVLWEVRHPDHHHDARRLRNGNVLLLCNTALPPDLVPRVRGGIPGTEVDGNMWADYIVEMTTAGETVWEWRSWEHLDPEIDVIGAFEPRDEWTHGNTVCELADGNIALSFRNISTVVVVDRHSGDVIWKIGQPILAQQHAPTPLPNGNLLIFDNGVHRIDNPTPSSRIIEVAYDTRQVVWSYQDPRPIDFFSPYISNAQRLANGNTLVCEGNFGRLFEVTPAGELVWEFVSPYFCASVDQPGMPATNNVFRAFRYSAAEIDAARTAT